MKRAAIYLRVSTSDQNYDRQKIELEQLATALGYKVVCTFEEKKSAVLKMDTREQLTNMRKLTKEDVDRIFIWDITRLSRRAIDFISLINEFADKGICLHFKDKNIITLDEDGSLNALTGMYLYLLGVFAQMDAENLKAKMKSGKEAALLKGNSYTNIAPFGYELKNKHLYINEDEAKYVKRAFELYRDGKDTQYIADMFNANAIPLKSGRRDIIWVKGTISQILNNTVYYGKGKRTTTIQKATSNIPAEVTIRYFDTPAIISKELFDECRRIAAVNICKQDKSRNIICLLRGLLKCGRCGRFYVLGNNNKQREYRDGDLRANVNNRIGCKNGSIKAVIADYLVWKAIQDIYKYNKFKEKCIEEKERYRSEFADNEKAIMNIEKELSQIDNQSNNLVKLAIKELLSEDEFAKQKLELDAEKNRKISMLEEIKTSNLILQRKIDSEFDYDLLDSDNELSKGEMKQIFNELIDDVLIYKYDMYKKVLQVNLKMDITYNIIINTQHSISSYCIINNTTATYNDPYKSNLLLNDKDVNISIPDFSVTSNNNDTFDDEVFGDYTFDEFWDICYKYNLIKPIPELRDSNS
jgi:resolvase, N domain protein|nr:MAG TPA: integrase [Caudoviricetes sp.]